MSRWLLILGLCLSGCTLSESPPDALFADGSWAGPICLPANPDFEEYAAARALAEACEQVTGVRPMLCEEDDLPAPPHVAIYLGRTAAAARAGVVAPEADGDTAVRRTIGASLYVVGNSPLATRIAVGRLCEQALGITFVMPGVDGMDYEPLDHVDWPDDETWRPAFAWRSVSGLDDAESIEWGRRVGFGTRPACTHGLANAFTPELYARRPELFALARGKRLPPTQGGRSPQPNLAHPAAAAVAADHLKRAFLRDPSAKVLPLGINDSLVYDDGLAARPALGEAGRLDGRPNRSDYVFGFLNRVAASDWNPGGDRAIGCLAYLDALAAPSFPIDPAIFPAICADRIQYANPEFAKLEADNLLAWSRSGARRLGTWDYLFGRDVVIPRWHPGAQAAAIAAQRDARVASWYAELDPLWAYDAPKAWLAAKLADDPEADAAELAEQWAEAAYGPAAPAMLALQGEVAQVWESVALRRTPGQWLVGWRDGCSADELLSPALEAAAATALAEARAALAEAPPDARHDRMRWRLAQFERAWRLSLAEARRSRLANAIGAGRADFSKPAALWASMLAAEIARDRAQADLNGHLWAGSQPVRWSASTQGNPWPLIAERLTSAELAAVTFPAEAPAAARVAIQAVRRSDRATAAERTLVRRLPSSLAEMQGPGTNHWCADFSRLVPSARGTAVRGLQGTFRWTAQVSAGEILRVSVDADAPASFAEGVATLTVRFPSAPRPPPSPPPLHAPAPPPSARALPYSVRIWGRTVLEVPTGADPGGVAEVEIAFVDGLPRTRDITLERIPARR